MGLVRHVLYFATFMASVEAGVYAMHRSLHHVRLYRCVRQRMWCCGHSTSCTTCGCTGKHCDECIAASGVVLSTLLISMQPAYGCAASSSFHAS